VEDLAAYTGDVDKSSDGVWLRCADLLAPLLALVACLHRLWANIPGLYTIVAVLTKGAMCLQVGCFVRHCRVLIPQNDFQDCSGRCRVSEEAGHSF
jgi:hypothetical protein